jgi:hypothetical protein
MTPSRTSRTLLAAAVAILTGLAISSGDFAAAKEEPDGCDTVTGELIDHGTTVTARFHVETTCAKVSVLSFFAVGPHGEYPQVFLDRIGQENVPPGDYEWTIEAPPPECFRQIDLRVPDRNVDVIVGGEKLCEKPPTSTTTTIGGSTTTSPTSTTTSSTTTTSTTSTTTSTTSTTTSTTSSTTSTTSTTTTSTTVVSPPSSTPGETTTTTVAGGGGGGGGNETSATSPTVLGNVITPAPTSQELARTGGGIVQDLIGLGFIGTGVGLVAIALVRRPRRQPQP